MIEFVVAPLALVLAVATAGWLSLFLLLVVLTILTAFAANERADVVALLLVIAALVSWFFGEPNLPSYVWNNPGDAFGYVGLWLALGAGWALYRWDRVVVTKVKEWTIFKASLTAENRSQPEYLEARKQKYIPAATDHKGEITNWIALWPFDAFWYFLDELLLNLFTNIFNMLRGTFDRIAAWRFKDV